MDSDRVATPKLKSMNRTPPADVLRELREEVGYGCPIPGCGSPYLEWHHFDPPWHEKQHHDPVGMIALCRDHHPEADAGTFTKEQLRQIKLDGIQQSPILYGKFNWLRNDLIVVAGQLAAIRTPVVLQLWNTPVIWVNRDSHGMQLLNVIMVSETSTRPIILDNFWMSEETPRRFECPPSGKKLKIEYANGELLHVEFHELRDFQAAQKKFGKRFNVSVWQVNYPSTVANIMYRTANREIELKPTGIRAVGFATTRDSGISAIDCGCLIRCNEGNFGNLRPPNLK